MRAWGQAFRIPTAGRGRAQASMGMSCQPIAGYEREMFSAGCTMNIGSKKLLREVASTFCGAQVRKNSLRRILSKCNIVTLLSHNERTLNSPREWC